MGDKIFDIMHGSVLRYGVTWCWGEMSDDMWLNLNLNWQNFARSYMTVTSLNCVFLSLVKHASPGAKQLPTFVIYEISCVQGSMHANS